MANQTQSYPPQIPSAGVEQVYTVYNRYEGPTTREVNWSNKGLYYDISGVGKTNFDFEGSVETATYMGLYGYGYYTLINKLDMSTAFSFYIPHAVNNKFKFINIVRIGIHSNGMPICAINIVDKTETTYKYFSIIVCKNYLMVQDSFRDRYNGIVLETVGAVVNLAYSTKPVKNTIDFYMLLCGTGIVSYPAIGMTASGHSKKMNHTFIELDMEGSIMTMNSPKQFDLPLFSPPFLNKYYNREEYAPIRLFYDKGFVSLISDNGIQKWEVFNDAPFPILAYKGDTLSSSYTTPTQDSDEVSIYNIYSSNVGLDNEVIIRAYSKLVSNNPSTTPVRHYLKFFIDGVELSMNKRVFYPSGVLPVISTKFDQESDTFVVGMYAPSSYISPSNGAEASDGKYIFVVNTKTKQVFTWGSSDLSEEGFQYFYENKSLATYRTQSSGIFYQLAQSYGSKFSIAYLDILSVVNTGKFYVTRPTTHEVDAIVASDCSHSANRLANSSGTVVTDLTIIQFKKMPLSDLGTGDIVPVDDIIQDEMFITGLPTPELPFTEPDPCAVIPTDGEGLPLEVTPAGAYTVDGYLRDKVMDSRTFLAPLMAAFQIYAIEKDGNIHFAKKTRKIAATIYEEQIVTEEQDFEITVTQESELPARVTVKFINSEEDFNIGAEFAQRYDLNSVVHTEIDLPIAFTADKAAKFAQTMLAEAFNNRTKVTFMAVGYKLMWLNALDLVLVQWNGRTYSVRIERISYSIPNRVLIEGTVEDMTIGYAEVVPEDDFGGGCGIDYYLKTDRCFQANEVIASDDSKGTLTVYNSSAMEKVKILSASPSTKGSVSSDTEYSDSGIFTSNSSSVPSTYVKKSVIDSIPAKVVVYAIDSVKVLPTHATSGMYLVGYNEGLGSQSSTYSVNMKIDGVEAGQQLITLSDTVFGLVAEPTNTQTGINPSLIDEVTKLTVNMKAGALTTTTPEGAVTEPKYFLWGVNGRWELIQFLTATLISEGKYELSRLMRGRLGTEANMTKHIANDNLILIDAKTLDISIAQSNRSKLVSFTGGNSNDFELVFTDARNTVPAPAVSGGSSTGTTTGNTGGSTTPTGDNPSTTTTITTGNTTTTTTTTTNPSGGQTTTVVVVTDDPVNGQTTTTTVTDPNGNTTTTTTTPTTGGGQVPPTTTTPNDTNNGWPTLVVNGDGSISSIDPVTGYSTIIALRQAVISRDDVYSITTAVENGFVVVVDEEGNMTVRAPMGKGFELGVAGIVAYFYDTITLKYEWPSGELQQQSVIIYGQGGSGFTIGSTGVSVSFGESQKVLFTLPSGKTITMGLAITQVSNDYSEVTINEDTGDVTVKNKAAYVTADLDTTIQLDDGDSAVRTSETTVVFNDTVTVTQGQSNVSIGNGKTATYDSDGVITVTNPDATTATILPEPNVEVDESNMPLITTAGSFEVGVNEYVVIDLDGTYLHKETGTFVVITDSLGVEYTIETGESVIVNGSHITLNGLGNIVITRTDDSVTTLLPKKTLETTNGLSLLNTKLVGNMYSQSLSDGTIYNDTKFLEIEKNTNIIKFGNEGYVSLTLGDTEGTFLFLTTTGAALIDVPNNSGYFILQMQDGVILVKGDYTYEYLYKNSPVLVSSGSVNISGTDIIYISPEGTVTKLGSTLNRDFYHKTHAIDDAVIFDDPNAIIDTVAKIFDSTGSPPSLVIPTEQSFARYQYNWKMAVGGSLAPTDGSVISCFDISADGLKMARVVIISGTGGITPYCFTGIATLQLLSRTTVEDKFVLYKTLPLNDYGVWMGYTQSVLYPTERQSVSMSDDGNTIAVLVCRVESRTPYPAPADDEYYLMQEDPFTENRNDILYVIENDSVVFIDTFSDSSITGFPFYLTNIEPEHLYVKVTETEEVIYHVNNGWTLVSDPNILIPAYYLQFEDGGTFGSQAMEILPDGSTNLVVMRDPTNSYNRDYTYLFTIENFEELYQKQITVQEVWYEEPNFGKLSKVVLSLAGKALASTAMALAVSGDGKRVVVSGEDSVNGVRSLCSYQKNIPYSELNGYAYIKTYYPENSPSASIFNADTDPWWGLNIFSNQVQYVEPAVLEVNELRGNLVSQSLDDGWSKTYYKNPSTSEVYNHTYITLNYAGDVLIASGTTENSSSFTKTVYTLDEAGKVISVAEGSSASGFIKRAKGTGNYFYSQSNQATGGKFQFYSGVSLIPLASGDSASGTVLGAAAFKTDCKYSYNNARIVSKSAAYPEYETLQEVINEDIVIYNDFKNMAYYDRSILGVVY